MLIDIHTHSPNEKAGISLVDASLQNVAASRPANVLYSMGIHPCNIPENWKENAEIIREALRKHKIAAVGECGFDRTSPFPLEMQREVFDQAIKNFRRGKLSAYYTLRARRRRTSAIFQPHARARNVDCARISGQAGCNASVVERRIFDIVRPALQCRKFESVPRRKDIR